MVQMTASDQIIVKALGGNNGCAECGMKNPQWASVSFGTVFCLECSGVHRSLGVHISFVRSIAMDSWTDKQMALMKAGGNAKCAAYLTAKGVAPTTPIKQKYEHHAAQLYKEVLKARVEGRPEPTSIPTPKPRNNNYNNNNVMKSMPNVAPATGKPGEDPNGMEQMTGETEPQYVARQTRLREEARKRMQAKFGNSGGLGGGNMGGVGSSSMSGGGGGGGGGRMAGIGSNSNYDPNRGGYGSGVTGNLSVDSVGAAFGSALSMVGSVASTASQTVSSVVQDEGARQSVRNLAGSVTNTGTSFWNSFSSTISSVAQNVTQPDGGDGLAELQQQCHSQRSMTESIYEGFGSDSKNGGMTTASSAASTSATPSLSGPVGECPGLSGEDRNGVGALTGETDEQYMARQHRIRDEAKARMAAKFGKGGMSSAGSSSSANTGSAPGGGTPSAPSSGNSFKLSTDSAPPARPPPSSGNSSPSKPPQKLQVDDNDDFFSNFGT